VQDSGTGIPASEIPRLFERFYRVPNARGRSNEGTGIGLALVNELVRLHGGTLSVRSAEGIGSTFTVNLPFGSGHLPAEQVHSRSETPTRSMLIHSFLEEIDVWHQTQRSERAAGTHPAEPPHTPLPTSNRRVHILLADDNADMREYVRHLIGKEFSVATA